MSEDPARRHDDGLVGYLVDAGPCPYGVAAHFRALHLLQPLGAVAYRRLLDRRFRRSGPFCYAPVCEGCTACVPLRVPVARFQASRSQRRCLRRNADLTVTWHPRGYDAERARLYRHYQERIHHDPIDDEQDPQGFLVDDGGIPGGELHARDADGRLLAVVSCDLVGDCWSSVYCYWLPSQARRGLGTFMALQEIAACLRRGLTWYYLGYWVRDCPKMAYKAAFKPHQLLIDGVFREVER